MRALLSVLLLSLGCPLLLQAQQLPLPLNSRGQGSVTDETPTHFQFIPPAAGLLTIAATSGIDLGIRVLDPDGQVLPGGVADVDFAGNPGLEYLTVPISSTEPVVVEISSLSGDAGAFIIATTFIIDSAFTVESDPDRRPMFAQPLGIGTPHADSLDPVHGDRWDWYRITADHDGSLVFITRAEDEENPGDLMIELFLSGDVHNVVATSDDDLQGVVTNESVTAMVKKGDTILVRVSAVYRDINPFGYRVSVAQVP